MTSPKIPDEVEKEIIEAAQALIDEWTPHCKTAIFNAHNRGARAFYLKGLQKSEERVNYLENHLYENYVMLPGDFAEWAVSILKRQDCAITQLEEKLKFTETKLTNIRNNGCEDYSGSPESEYARQFDFGKNSVKDEMDALKTALDEAKIYLTSIKSKRMPDYQKVCDWLAKHGEKLG